MLEQHYLRSGTGALPDVEDKRDLVFMASTNQINWSKGFDIYKKLDFKPVIKNQGSSLSCVGQAVAAYAEVINYVEEEVYKPMSPKSIYAQIRLPSGGAYLRDGMKRMVDYGINLEESVESGLKEEDYKDKKFLTIDRILKQAGVYASNSFYMTPLYNNIDVVAKAIERGHGALIGFWGYNDGIRQADIVAPPIGTKKIFGHGVYGCAYGMRNGKKAIKFQNSWSDKWGDNGFGYMNEDYFDARRAFSPWTLIDKKNLMSNYKTLIVRDGKKWGVGIDTGRNLFVEFASSIEEYKLIGLKFGIEVIEKDGAFVEPNIILNKQND